LHPPTGYVASATIKKLSLGIVHPKRKKFDRATQLFLDLL